MLTSKLKNIYGTLYVNDAGESHGGFEESFSWLAWLRFSEGKGELIFAIEEGALGRKPVRTRYQLTEFSHTDNFIKFKIDGRPVEMIWIENDDIWNGEFDKHYIAAWGSNSDPKEIKGVIRSDYFAGINKEWYVELRLR